MKVFAFILILPLICFPNENYNEKVKKDFLLIKEILEMFILDDGFYPELTSIEEFKDKAMERQYAEELNIKDPSGRFYKIISKKNHYKVSTFNGSITIENGFEIPKEKK